MANTWFRMYAEFASDAKVQMMSEAMQRRLLMVFCLRCSDVTVTLSDDEIAFQMRISADELAETKALFVRKGFIDSAWNVLNWEKRQFASDSSATRTRAYRDRKRDKPVTSHVTERDSLEQNRTDTEQKREEQAAPVVDRDIGNPASATPISSRSPTGSRLPSDWQPSTDLVAWALENGNGIDVAREAEKFRDFWTAKAGKDGRKLDWPATWRNWIRRAAEGRGGNGGGALFAQQQPQAAGGGRRAL
ncbi:hypothetical protein [Stenotrophomonas maltophilia]|uniref:hypothetical protein n=1 Tax=Stenotrophomonas maltophilia TaxID=40324 RepID=UPI00290579F3|nr:hypothetical protein [Stenotrophomonas maltophilia]MCU1169259.1 hypothetical protein [Stenotrophomonas maltophilia]